MKYAEFDEGLRQYAQTNGLSAGKLETYIGYSDQLVAEGKDPPDGGAWLGSDGQPLPIQQLTPSVRFAVRNYAGLFELLLPSGEAGINISAHAPNADRFL